MYFAASSAIVFLPVALRYLCIESLKGKTEVVAPISAPILQIVPVNLCAYIVVEEIMHTHSGGRKGINSRAKVLNNSSRSSLYRQDISNLNNTIIILLYSCFLTFRITSLAEVHPDNFPVSLIPITLGHLSSHGISAITSTASAPIQYFLKIIIRHKTEKETSNSDAKTTESTTIRSVRVSSNEQKAGESVILEDNLEKVKLFIFKNRTDGLPDG